MPECSGHLSVKQPHLLTGGISWFISRFVRNNDRSGQGGEPPQKTQLLLLLNLLLSGSRISWINWTVTSDRTRCVTHLLSLLSANSEIMPNFFVCLLCSGQGDFLWLMTKLVIHVFMTDILTLLSLSKHYMLLFILWIRDYHFSRYINLTDFGFLFLRISFVFSCFCAFIFNMFVTNLCFFFSCSWCISLFFTAHWSSVLFLCYGLNWLDRFVALKLIQLFVKPTSYLSRWG